MRKRIFIVVERTDALITNAFTSADQARHWVDSERLGNTIAGPFDVESEQNTPFDIVLGCDTEVAIESVYAEENLDGDEQPNHDRLLGPYTVYDTIESYEEQLQAP